MLTYLCTACGKKHTAATFNGPFTAECLRCRAAFVVTEGMIRAVPGRSERSEAIAVAPRAAGGRQELTPDRRGTDAGGEDAPDSPAVSEPGSARNAGQGITTEPTRRNGAGKRLGRGEGVDPQGGDQFPAPEDADEDSLAPGRPKKKKDGAGSKKKKACDGSAARASLAGEAGDPVGGDVRAAHGEATATTTGGRRRYLILAGVLGLVLAGGTGAYFFFGGQEAAPKKVAAVPPRQQQPADKGQADKGKQEVKKTPVPPDKGNPSGVVRKPLVPTLAVAAPVLSAELEESAARAHAKYDGQILIVSGLFAEAEALLPAEKAPEKDKQIASAKDTQKGTEKEKKQRISFQVDGKPVRCELFEPLADIPAVGHYLSVVGRYEGGILREGDLLPPLAVADFRYKSKVVELTGVVSLVEVPARGGEAVPTVSLEGDVFSQVRVQCAFPHDAAESLRKLPRQAVVTIRGTCSGRKRVESRGQLIRLDDCQLVTTPDTRGDVRRLDVRAFLREYEQDLRPDYLAAFGEEPVAGTKTVEQLAKEYLATPGGLTRKYRGKRLTVTGVVATLSAREVLLETGRTGLSFKVSGRLDREPPDFAEEVKQRTISGVCLDGGQTMRLVYCREVGAPTKVQRLTAEFLPHRKGRVLTYDLAVYPKGEKGKAVVGRQLWFEGDGGVTETVTTHTTTLNIKNLFSPPLANDWVKKANVSKVRLPGPVFTRTEASQFLEVAQRAAASDKPDLDGRVPVIKLGARAGDSWEWKRKVAKHHFTLERFEDFKGKPCAVIKEVVRKDLSDLETTEVLHKYALGIGEIERAEVFRPSPKEQRKVLEGRLVDVEEAAQKE